MTQLLYNTSRQIGLNKQGTEQLGLYTQIGGISQSDNSEITQNFGLYRRWRSLGLTIKHESIG